MTKTWKHGRYLITSRLPLTCEDLYTLNQKNSESIELVWKKVMKGTWKLLEVRR